jgi:hypothetical protein
MLVPPKNKYERPVLPNDDCRKNISEFGAQLLIKIGEHLNPEDGLVVLESALCI